MAPSEALTLDHAIELAERCLGDVTTVGELATGFADLGDIVLPPIVGASADADLLRLATPLYLAAELEAAGLVEALDALAALAASGGIEVDLGELGNVLVEVWRERNRRFTAEERRAFHARLFGTFAGTGLATRRSNQEFEARLITLAESLIAIRSEPPGRWAPAGVTTSALLVAANVATHAGGVPARAASDLIGEVKTALDVLSDTRMQRALGARSVWDAVDQANRRLRQVERDVVSRVRRGRAGVTILAWLAEVAPTLDTRAVMPPVALVDAAVEWVEATLALWRTEQGRTAQGE